LEPDLQTPFKGYWLFENFEKRNKTGQMVVRIKIDNMRFNKEARGGKIILLYPKGLRGKKKSRWGPGKKKKGGR